MVIMFINSLLMKCLVCLLNFHEVETIGLKSTIMVLFNYAGAEKGDTGWADVPPETQGSGSTLRDQPHNNIHPVQIIFCWERIA